MKNLLKQGYIIFLAFKNYLFLEWIMRIPFLYIRMFFIKYSVSTSGENCFIAMAVDFKNGEKIIIGNNTVINKRTLLDGRGGLSIGNHVDIAQDVKIWTLSHVPNDDYHTTIGKHVIIEDYVWIAAGATILPGVKIGRGAVVGTGSVVTKDVEPMMIVAGNPAKTIGIRESNLLYNLNFMPWFR